MRIAVLCVALPAFSAANAQMAGTIQQAEMAAIHAAFVADPALATWVPELNPIALRAPDERARMASGVLVEDPIQALPRRPGVASLPDYFSWHEHPDGDYLTPIRDQGACGSCVAFAVTGALEGGLNIAAGDPDWDLDLSEQHIFSCGGGKCSQGWYVSSALSYVRDWGEPAESCNAYIAGYHGDQDCSMSCADWEDKAVQIAGWDFVTNDVEAIQSYLIEGPLVTTMDIYRDFYYYRSGVYRHVSNMRDGRHAVVLVGWSNADSCWIARNSWGPEWGDGGYFRIAYGDSRIGTQTARMTQYPTFRVSADRSLYGPGDQGFIAVSLHNPGADFRGEIRIWAEGAPGARLYLFSGVRTLPSGLVYENPTALDFTVPLVDPGNYDFFGSLRRASSGNGPTCTFSSTPFEITE